MEFLKKQGCPFNYNTLIKNNKIYNIGYKTILFEKRKFNIVEFIHGRNRDCIKARNRRVKRKK
jgi:hypothetical protein